MRPGLDRHVRPAAWRAAPARQGLLWLCALAVLGGCAGPARQPPPPRGAGASAGAEGGRSGLAADGPPAQIPEHLADVPDAEPRIEPIRPGGPNKPYEAFGDIYVPVLQDRPFRQRGLASWYGRKFQGRRTSSGEPYDMFAMTAAHPTLPIPSYARVRNPASGAEVVLRVNDRGPFHSDRIVDLSYTAALKLGVLNGVTVVELERITFDDIRTGAWRRGAPVATALASAAPAPPAAPVPVPVPATVPSQRPMPAPMPAQMPLPVEPTGAGAAGATLPTSAPPPGPAAAEAANVAQAAGVAPAAASASGFWVQLGAFQQRDGAERFHRRVAADVHWLAPLLLVFTDQQVHRLQAGPYASREEAQDIARRVREVLKLVPLVLERR